MLAGNGHPDTSLGGGTKLSRLANHDMAGVLADGRLRDFHELAEYGFATWCRGEATRWGGDIVTPYEADRPVVVDGVGIFPGDYIFADRSGAVAIPRAQVTDVVAEARRIVAADAGFIESIRTEDPSELAGDER